ncbi:MAG: hypothetical protein UW37_C0014G0005 [Candidatus Gottesmanbacteria bacterium GW2011_GWA2_44_17]|uniref:Transposase IS200-like domain-containing protein n=3 Tax=Candidatus Gottesmaniibacteriota TaxID=1752720 RepID=A0A0G1IGD6_9BACT|nr:MAG: hypothetical protein UV63_C0038G0012 [Microgenomates group bacterium GW2011_GWC1_43_11]KKT38703.1 MAG: hypothetical protein UW22_C0007G0006 [Candidatus Gottesmanbacteria bacterium GW2011_GWB1_44_11c]KKT47023.1 MAG: hypothetical protein UW37_C0014G0005 [Candidatus Gottesmanbacteria bacterium GW2011_GWA2_44_17]KKT58220.1 MAG: hypothetical protein UW52_C0063G0004 [Candidatus Gottesmanbacteria bacterium GW2011_GWA1_44_24b]HCM82613.1 hypothetical protein [Patescibacteria group bacterium]
MYKMYIMPYRFEPCYTGEIYHIFNRSVGQQSIFSNSSFYTRFCDLMSYYRFDKPPYRFSEYIRLPMQAQLESYKRLTSQKQLVDILTFCIMPNHFHMLLRQKQDDGIRRFATIIQNAYAKYFNTKTNRSGAVFQAMFKSVRIETDDQLLHVARYIHLNPYSAKIVTSLSDLENYPWSSFVIYMGHLKGDWMEQNTLLSYGKTIEALKKYTFDQADYQRLLSVESHLYHD